MYFILLDLQAYFKYRKVASSNTSLLEAHAGFFTFLMKGIFDPYYGHLNSIQVGSNEMHFTARKGTERNRQRDRKMYVMIS